jgi:hypothetical protein
MLGRRDFLKLSGAAAATVALPESAPASEILPETSYEAGTVQMWEDTIAKRAEHAGVYVTYTNNGEERNIWIPKHVLSRSFFGVTYRIKVKSPESWTVRRYIHTHPSSNPPNDAEIGANRKASELFRQNFEQFTEAESVLTAGIEYRFEYHKNPAILKERYIKHPHFNEDFFDLRERIIMNGLQGDANVCREYDEKKISVLNAYGVTIETITRHAKSFKDLSNFWETNLGKELWESYCTCFANFGITMTRIKRTDLRSV